MGAPALPQSGSGKKGESGEEFHPQVFHQYFLLERVAFGGMAQIYRAKSFGASGFERELVVKRVLASLLKNPDFLQMLTNEAKLTAMLSHGNIAQVFELGLHEGIYYITMEFVEGVSLKEFIRSSLKAGGPPSIHEACFAVIEMLEGLDYAHRKADWTGKSLGIVHCDISPDNVVTSYDGVVKVLDFGIARAANAFSNYKEGMVMGKFNYVAPEQAMGGPVDARADIFSTGIVLYELLTGEHPFGRGGDISTLMRIAKLEPGMIAPPSKHNYNVPAALDDIVLKAMSPQKGERYGSAREMEMALLRFIHPETPASLQPRIAERLHTLYRERIERRRQVRSRDDEILRRLQRDLAERGTPTTAGPAGRPMAPARANWPVRVLLAAAALGIGFGAGRFLAPRPAGSAVVVANVPNARVSLDRAPVEGVPPLVLPQLSDGRPYLVEVSAEGYRPFTFTFQARAGATEIVDARLEPKVK
jgi:serine/threonine protein kinase